MGPYELFNVEILVSQGLIVVNTILNNKHLDKCQSYRGFNS